MPFKDPIKAKEYRQAYQKAYHADPENRERANRRRRERGRGAELAKTRARYAAMTTEQRAARLAYMAEMNIRWRFGLSVEDQRALRARAAGLCEICKRPDTLGKRLAFDHDHKTERVRGLLCGLCNRGLGLFLDSPENLEKAAAYLRGQDPSK